MARMVLISRPHDLPTSASQSAGITGVSHCTRPSKCLLILEAPVPVPGLLLLLSNLISSKEARGRGSQLQNLSIRVPGGEALPL